MGYWKHFYHRHLGIILFIISSNYFITLLNAQNHNNNNTSSSSKVQIRLSRKVGDSVELGCPVGSRLGSELNWKFNNTLLDPHRLLTRFVLRSHSLRIEALELKDTGFYTCEICVHRNSCAAHITQLIIENVAASPPTTATTTSATTSSSSSSSSIEDDYNNFSSIKSLTITKTSTESDISTQEIHDINNNSYLEQNDTEPESLPKFIRSAKMTPQVTKPAGSSIIFNCPATGNPLPTIIWTCNDTEINRQIGGVRLNKFSMKMDDLIPYDSGSYKCIVCNRHGCIEHTTKLNVIERLRTAPIHSDRFPMNQTVLTNTSAIFECRVVSDLEPAIIWVRYIGENILEKSVHDLESRVPRVMPSFTEYEEHGLEHLIANNEERPQFLRLDNITHADEGWYTCIAANTLGQSLASAYLRVVDKFPTRELYSLFRSHPMSITVVIIVVILLFSFGTIFLIYVLRKLKHEKLLKQRIEHHSWTKRIIIYKAPSYEGDSSWDLQVPIIKIERKQTTFTAPANCGDATTQQVFNDYEFPLDSNWEIPRDQLKLGETLGEGAFGRVVMAEALSLGACARLSNLKTGGGGGGAGAGAGVGGGGYCNEPLIVAVKMVKDEITDADMASLVREMEVMKQIGRHKNIINLLACCSQNGPLWVVVEYAPYGNLKDFLKQNRPMINAGNNMRMHHQQRHSTGTNENSLLQLTEKKLISFAFQIARGMEYLASRKQITNKILIKQKHLIEAFNTTRPSLNADDVARYKKTYARFTNKEKGSSSREYVAKRATLA